jgi:isopentenyldiphosphate isomerase/intracellular septation protein A
MNLAFFKKILPGLLPLFIFVLADEIWGTKVGLFTALVFGLAEFVYYYIKDKRIDKFILLDTGLLIALGLFSLALENEIFFKIKPALTEVILLAIIAFSLWGPHNLVVAMSQRYTGDFQLNPGQEKVMRMNLIVVFWITLFHIILVFYSARYMSEKAWLFISGGLFYIMFAIYIAGLWIFNLWRKRQFCEDEWFPIVTIEGYVTGKAPRRVCHDGKSRLLHPVVHLHLVNGSGRLFLQKRALTKDIEPGKWDTAVGGHVSLGETIEEALSREAREELDLKSFRPRFLGKYVWESPVEKELVFSFITETDMLPVINRKEIAEGRYWSMNEIKSNIGKEIFTPNFEKEILMFFNSKGIKIKS